ncbi:hypothetical protein ACIQCJ_12595 [Streptomyces sp. NPDC093221]|uniref:hypothetical protein n=1 Tax=Streptomyces sp. NPDC093221 TaxID=3366032 RepID=UPI0038094185
MADAPWTLCRYSGGSSVAPNIAAPTAKIIIDESRTFRVSNTRNGRTGSAARRCEATKAARPSAAATASAPIRQEAPA